MPTVKAAFGRFINAPSRTRRQARSPYTVRKYHEKLRPFIEKYGDRPVKSITQKQVQKWFGKLSEKYSEGTLSIYRNCLKAFLEFCKEEGWAKTNPAARIRPYSSIPAEFVTADENNLEIALTICGFMSLSAAPGLRRDAAIFALAAISGARRSNLKAMPFEETVAALARPRDGGELGPYYVVRTGGKQPMDIVFGEWHATIVRRYLVVRPEASHNLLFVHFRLSSYGEPLQEQGLNVARATICRLADVPPISYQAMRKLKGSQVEERYGLEIAAQVLGHRSGTKVVQDHYCRPNKKSVHLAVLTPRIQPFQG